MINTFMSILTMLVLGCWIGALIALSVIVLARMARTVIKEFYLK